jgi:hypothetical protein
VKAFVRLENAQRMPPLPKPWASNTAP